MIIYPSAEKVEHGWLPCIVVQRNVLERKYLGEVVVDSERNALVAALKLLDLVDSKIRNALSDDGFSTVMRQRTSIFGTDTVS